MDKYDGFESEKNSVISSVDEVVEMSHNNNQIGIINAIFSTFIYMSILNFAGGLTVSDSSYRWAYLVIFTIFATLFFYAIKKITYFTYEILDNISIKNIIISLICAALVLIINFSLNKFVLINAFNASYENLLYGFQYFNTIQALIYVCILGPIWEELLHRGYILKGLRNKYGTIVSLIISSLIFAVFHMNIVQGINAFIMGMVFGVLFIKTGSIFSCMIAHIINNSIAMYIQLF